MKKSINSFEEMNSLSEHGIPFFFIIDFLKENIIILQKSELYTLDILINFPHFRHEKLVEKIQKEITYVKGHIGTENMSGKAIQALENKLDEVGKNLDYYKTFIGDCFGDQS